MEELYVQDFGQKKVIAVVGWNNDRALLEDLQSGLRYTLDWDIFFQHHIKLDADDLNAKDYEGVNLDPWI